MSKKMLDLIWKLDIETINDHLPLKQKNLKLLLMEKVPTIETKDNKKQKIRKKDLEKISNLIPEEEWEKIKLPIILLRRTKLEKGLYSVSGGKQELYILHKILGKTKKCLEIFLKEEKKPYLWKPEVYTLKKELPTLIVIGFA